MRKLPLFAAAAVTAMSILSAPVTAHAAVFQVAGAGNGMNGYMTNCSGQTGSLSSLISQLKAGGRGNAGCAAGDFCGGNYGCGLGADCFGGSGCANSECGFGQNCASGSDCGLGQGCGVQNGMGNGQSLPYMMVR